MEFFVLTRFVLVKYSRAFVERLSQGTSSLALRLTTISLNLHMLKNTLFVKATRFITTLHRHFSLAIPWLLALPFMVL